MFETEQELNSSRKHTLTRLKEKVKENKVMLFAGAGVSASVGLPSWKGLINRLANDLDYDAEIFETYGNYMELAEYYRIERGSLKSVQNWMKTNWENSMVRTAVEASPIYKAIVDIDFPIIYTTNYDHCLEYAYEGRQRPYKRIVKAGDMVGIAQDTTQIVKFHGDMDSCKSMVMAERDYFKRMNFEAPLDIKLRADMLSHSVLFIGYSLSDMNIRYMMYQMQQLWKKEKHRPKLYIFMGMPNPIQERILEKRGFTVISGDSEDQAESLREFLVWLGK